MFTGLLSDLYKMLNPSYQPDTFKPYLSMIFTIVTFTILVYSFQLITIGLHAYSEKPIAFQNTGWQNINCNIFIGSSVETFCNGVLSKGSTYKPDTLLSFEQDLQMPMK